MQTWASVQYSYFYCCWFSGCLTTLASVGLHCSVTEVEGFKFSYPCLAVYHYECLTQSGNLVAELNVFWLDMGRKTYTGLLG